jgi:hypothetical protein
VVKQQAAAVVQVAAGRALDGRYRLDVEIGTGGLGVVYRATHEKLARSVAVKLLHAHLGDDALMRARFEREARALAALEHPNIVSVTDFGVEGDTPYLVMELLEGQTLAERLTQGALDEANARELALSLLSALAYVHAAGLVHRDVKPGNVFLHRLKEGGERLKLLDFGLAKFVLGEAPEDSSLTRSGTVVGTPAYMSPEQASGEVADARSDVYAAGVLILELVAGRLPFPGDPIEQLRGHLVAEIPKLAELNTARVAHPEFDAFIRRALAKRPAERFEDAKQMVIALEALPRPWFTRPSSVNADDHARTLVKAEALTVDMSTASGAPEALAPAERPAEAARRPQRARRSLLARAWPLALALAAGLGAWAYRTRPVAAPDAAAVEVPLQAAAPQLQTAPSAAAPEPPAPSEPDALPAAESGDDTERHAEPIESESDDVPAPAVVAAPRPRSPARNPWSRGVPKELRSVRTAAAKGARGSDHMIASLRRYNREHPSDVRGHLLLAGLYANREWRADALTQFQIAYQLDPSARGAPEMLPTLIGMVARGSGGAIRSIESVYRGEALPAVNRALRAHRDDARAVARLTNLRSRLLNH